MHGRSLWCSTLGNRRRRAVDILKGSERVLDCFMALKRLITGTISTRRCDKGLPGCASQGEAWGSWRPTGCVANTWLLQRMRVGWVVLASQEGESVEAFQL